MTRAMICCLALFALGPTVRAGELDREMTPAKSAVTSAAATVPAGSELDKESPQESHYYRGGWGWGGGGWGYRPAFGWGGWGGWGYRPAFGWGGFSPVGFYSPGFVNFRTYAWGWPGGFYNWSWVNYRTAFYPGGWYGYGWW